MTRDLTEKNLVEDAEVFADISNVNLYGGENVIQPEELELLPQEMIYKDGEGKPAITFIIYYGKEEWKRPLSILDMLDLDEEEKKKLQPFLLNHKIHLISLSSMNEEEVEKYKSDFWHIIKFLTLHGQGKTRRYLEEESGKRAVKHPEEVSNVLYALSKDKRFLETYMTKEGKEELQMGPISDVLDEIEAIGFEKGIEQGIESGLIRINRLNAALIKDNRTVELFQSTQDAELQKKLMEEYGIQ